MSEAYKTWEELTLLEQMSCQFWDMYKDAHGIRPRGIDTSNWTEEDFRTEFEYLSQVIESNYRERRASEERAMIDFEMRVQSLIQAGAKDWDMAIRWLHEANETGGDDDYLCYCEGLPYGYFSQRAQ